MQLKNIDMYQIELSNQFKENVGWKTVLTKTLVKIMKTKSGQANEGWNKLKLLGFEEVTPDILWGQG